MPNWNTNLEGEQLVIAQHSGSPMRVIAGPGTGKSYGLQRKVMRLLEEGVDPSLILAVTFTNVAANGLKHDLQTELEKQGISRAKEIRACTLHSLCFRILRKQHVFNVTNRIPRPLINFEKQFLIEDLKDKYGGKDKVKELITAYESAFARLQEDTPGVIATPEDLEFQKDLLQWLKFHKAMLIGELIPLTISYLKNNPEAPERKEFKYILVDEYQDLNKAEQILISLLTSQETELVIVGDEDQSIYKFKNAHPTGITSFHEIYPTVKDVNLKICRRCPKKIVRLSNELMQYQLNKPQKVLAEKDENLDGLVDAVRWHTIDEETEGISQFIHKKLLDNTDLCPNDFLILSPRRDLGYALKKELGGKQIKAHTFFREDLLESDEAQRRYALLSFLVDNEDRAALRALLGMPTPLPKTYQKLERSCLKESKSPIEIFHLMESTSFTIPGTSDLLTRYQKICKEIEELKKLSVSDLINWLTSGLTNTDEFLNVIKALEGQEIPDLKNLYELVQQELIFPEITEEKDYVKIMSLHKSKGLSSKYVIIMSCCDGLIPSIKNEQKLIQQNRLLEVADLEEEAKRLFFVAVTRAKIHLVFSSFDLIDQAKALSLGGLKIKNKYFDRSQKKNIYHTTASRFLDLMPQELPAPQQGEEFLRNLGI